MITDIKMTEVKPRPERMIEQPLTGGGLHKGNRSVVTGFKGARKDQQFMFKKKFLN